MDALKALASKLKKEAHDVAGPSKYIKRSQLEEARLQKIRVEEATEREEKDRKRKLQLTEESLQTSKAPKNDDTPPESPTVLTREEVIRRLRALGEPATLFAESDFDRLKRLRKAEVEMAVNMEDDVGGGAGKGNALIDLQRQAQERARLRALGTSKPTDAGGAGGGSKGGVGGSKGAAAVPDKAEGDEADGSSSAVGCSSSADGATLDAFTRAAAKLAERRLEEALPVEDRITKYLKAWMKEWDDDLEHRSDVVKDSSSGILATFAFKQTARNMEPLYDRLRNRQITDELLTGLWMMVQSMRNRNYMHANDVYLKLAIGNAPWPIGVTSVGIHERSAREKISHVMNTNGQAHIMNDEATRKYFQSIKRLITQLQRLYPTDPSRSVDFDPVPDPGKGVQGGGCLKVALMEAERRGELTLALPAAPHFLDHDGSVRVPEKWSSILNRFRESSPSLAAMGSDDSSREGSPVTGAGGGGGTAAILAKH